MLLNVPVWTVESYSQLFLESKSFGTDVAFRKKNQVKKEKSTKNNVIITKIPVFKIVSLKIVFQILSFVKVGQKFEE